MVKIGLMIRKLSTDEVSKRKKMQKDLEKYCSNQITDLRYMFQNGNYGCDWNTFLSSYLYQTETTIKLNKEE